MKKRLLFTLLLPAAMVISSCENYGKKLSVGESEVFYKGEGVTEKDAEKVGDFLLENKLITKKERSSAQVTKNDGAYLVHLIMDSKKMGPATKLNMWKLQSDLSAEAFGGADARFAFTDDKFNDQEVLDPVSEIKVGKASLVYNSGEFKKTAANDLADFFKEQGFLSGEKPANVFVTKEEEAPVIRIVYDKDFLEENEAKVVPVFGYLQYLIQTNYPAFKKAKLWLTTKNYEDFKKIPKLSEEEIAAFQNSQTETQSETTSYSEPETSTTPASQD